MAYDGRVFRVLIASPSDVDDEREIVVRVIQEWNDLYSYARRVVLLPLRWETHTAPEYGVRPQEVVNRAIVDSCDLLVGVFWTRIGTPTGNADSGTLEEIERVAKAGKPVMLYFSRVGADPEHLDLAQLARLKTFKEATYPNALTESFKSQIEFRDKLAKQLELKIRELQKADDSGPPPLALAFAADNLKGTSGPKECRNLEVLDVCNLDTLLSTLPEEIRHSIAKEAERRMERARTLPVVLAVRNSSASGVRNLYLEISIEASLPDVEVSDRLRGQRTDIFDADVWIKSFRFADSDDEEPMADPWEERLRKDGDLWRLAIELDAIQPQRTRLIKPRLFIKTSSSCNVKVSARVFADGFPEPLPLTTTIDIVARNTTLSAEELLPDLEELKTTASKKGRRVYTVV
jgi:hypothetical protein